MASSRPEVSKFNSTLTYLLSTVEACVSRHFPKFATRLCPTHEICWCEECLDQYRKTGFTHFRNSCEHELAQCEDAAYSEIYINQLQFILKYADYLENMVEREIERHLELAETRNVYTSTERVSPE